MVPRTPLVCSDAQKNAERRSWKLSMTVGNAEKLILKSDRFLTSIPETEMDTNLWCLPGVAGRRRLVQNIETVVIDLSSRVHGKSDF